MGGAAREGGGPGDQHVGAGGDHSCCVLRRDPAIDLQLNAAAAVVDHAAQARDLGQTRVDETLAAEAGIDAHHQDQIDLVHHGFNQVSRRAGVERDAGLLSGFLDQPKGTMQMRPRFWMHGDDVGPGRNEGRDIGIDRRDHQMHVENLAAMRTQRLHDHRADGQIRHEMAVHHVDMNVIGPGVGDGRDLFAQSGEVG